ncbi:MAG TPA: hypothetical protein VMH30_05395 [Verrucomicrobiae bacterium]|nr:hypothetical protein [Verrucomicrobiae bacterium]
MDELALPNDASNPPSPEGGLKKRLASLLLKKKITKIAHAGRGQEIKWEIPVDICFKIKTCCVLGPFRNKIIDSDPRRKDVQQKSLKNK